jgi:SAM-dependent methyltransferase
LPFIRSIRDRLRRFDEWLSHLDHDPDPEIRVPPADRMDEIKAFLRSLDQRDEAARTYLEIHLDRIARTLTLTPPPFRTSRALELGTYMHMVPTLQRVFGYGEVRGAYLGPLGKTESKAVAVQGREVFRCAIDSFDAERDRFPYEDENFDLVLVCEMFEHMLRDPMHMLLEINRVLVDCGAMILTTPNVASYLAVARVLEQSGNPQLYSKYPDPHGEFVDTEVPHVREYTPQELREAIECAGFEVESLFTEIIHGYNCDLWVKDFLERNKYSTALRGEQLYCVARKRHGAALTRYPHFLYEGC